MRTSCTRAVDSEVERGLPSSPDAEYKTRYVDTLDAQRFGAIFLDGTNSVMFDRWNVRRDTDIVL